MPAANIIQLRQLLTGKFPGLRTRLNEGPPPSALTRPASRKTDDVPDLSPGALTEIVAESTGSGSALLLAALIQQALRNNQLVALVDGCDSFDVTRFDMDLSQLLWVRCRSADEALKAADLLLRDKNVSMVLIDLAANPFRQLRKIPATTWYRFQRLVEQTSAECAVLTREAMVSPARIRWSLSARFPLNALERDQRELLEELKLKVVDTRRSGKVREPLQNTA